MSGWRKLGVIAGGGELPVVLAEHLLATQRPYFIARIAPVAAPALEKHPGITLGLGAMGGRIDAMREAGCDAVVLIGQVARPDFKTLELDDVARAMLPELIAAMPKGDDALLRVLLAEHERAGFRVLGAEQVMGDLLAPEGAWGAIAPNSEHMSDIAKAAKVAAASGAFDIGQAIVVCDGLVLAVEAQEGTDVMLQRVADLPVTVRGTAKARRGVLLKRPKPMQERRIDLPTIGVKTVEGAAAAGLAGIAVEAHAALAVRRADVIAAANRAGLFLYGFTAAEAGET
jgi:DUF1009 family protein